MKRLFIAVLLTLLLAAGLAAAISYDPGYILIAFGLYTLETTFWVGAAVFLVILVLMYLVVMLLHRGLRQGSLFNRWRTDRQQRRGRQMTARGMVALAEGNFERARRVLDHAAGRSDMPEVNYLMAARASAALGDAKQTQLYLLRAERSGARPGIAVELTQAELQLRSGQLEASLATLTRVRRSAAKNPQVLSLLKDVYSRLRDWGNLLKLIPDLRRQRVLPALELDELEVRTTILWLEDTAVQGQIEMLHARWRELPKALVRNGRVVAAYARALSALGNGAEAERILRIQLKRDWSRELVSAYGQVAGADGLQQYKSAEQWLQNHGRDAPLLLCLGRLAVRNQLWGQAREYFEASLKLEENPETCAELGRLLAQLGQHERSNSFYERGLTALVRTAPLPSRPGLQRLS